MKIRNLALAAIATFAVTACATQESAKMDENVLTAKELQAVFKRGGGSCTWTAGDKKGEDYYYSTVSKSMGEADRMVGDEMMQGKWSLKGNELCTNFGTEQCSHLIKVDKKNYKATFDGVVYDMSC